jgi:DNA-binding NarL/FixJ family response regulator
VIKVLIVDDQKTVQEVLKSYLETETSIEIVGCADNGQEALDLVKAHRPHIVLMDIEMPILDGLTATKIISEQFIDTSVLIISVHNEDTYLNMALQVGAKGYLLKNTPAKELVNAVYSAYKGYFQLGPGLLEKYLYKVSEAQSNSQEIEQLKSVILQQSQFLKTLANDSVAESKDIGSNYSRRKNSQDALKNEYVNLEKQVYYLRDSLEKTNKRIIVIQQSLSFIVLFLVVLVLTIVIIGFFL